MRKIIIGLMAAAGLAAGALTATPAYATHDDAELYASMFVKQDRCGTRFDEFTLTTFSSHDAPLQTNYLVKHADGTWSGFAVADPGYWFWEPYDSHPTVIERTYTAFTNIPCEPGEKSKPKSYKGDYPAY